MDFKAIFTDLKDTTEEFDKQEIEKGKLMSFLSYLGIICLIPYFAEKDNKYVRYHAIQGLNLCLFSIMYSIAFAVLGLCLVFIPIIGWFILLLLSLLSYLFIVLAIWGIVYVFQDKAKEIPIVNKYKIIKK